MVWVSRERYAEVVGPDQHLKAAAELVVEVLSPGAENERRDRQTKLRLYGREGVLEYWIVDTEQRAVEVFRLDGQTTRLAATLSVADALTSPLLPGFALPVDLLFPLPKASHGMAEDLLPNPLPEGKGEPAANRCSRPLTILAAPTILPTSAPFP